MRKILIFFCLSMLSFAQDAEQLAQRDKILATMLEKSKEIPTMFEQYLQRPATVTNPFKKSPDKLFLHIEYLFFVDFDKKFEVINLFIPLAKKSDNYEKMVDYESGNFGKLRLCFSYEIVNDNEVKITNLRYKKLMDWVVATNSYFSDEMLGEVFSFDELVIKKGARKFFNEESDLSFQVNGVFENGTFKNWFSKVTCSERVIISLSEGGSK